MFKQIQWDHVLTEKEISAILGGGDGPMEEDPNNLPDEPPPV